MASSSPSLVGYFWLSPRREPLYSTRSSSFFLHSVIPEPDRETRFRLWPSSVHSTYLHTVIPKGFCPICDCPFVRFSHFFRSWPSHIPALYPRSCRPDRSFLTYVLKLYGSICNTLQWRGATWTKNHPALIKLFKRLRYGYMYVLPLSRTILEDTSQ